MRKFLIFIILISAPVWAAKKAKVKKVSFTKEWALSSFHFYQESDISNSIVNPGNRVLELPRTEWINELRPELSLTYLNIFKLNAKAAIQYIYEHHSYELPEEAKDSFKSHLDLKELFFENANKSDWGLRFGLLTYQWGPAEIASPSNGVFHFSANGRDYAFVEKGLILGDALYNISDQTSVQFLAEVASNNDPAFIPDEKFQPKGLMKLETSFENSFNYLGLTVGQMERKRNYTGMYGNWVPVEGYSLYFDARQTVGNLGFRPEKKAATRVDLTFIDNKKDKFLYSVVGARYEGDFDLRLEYISFDEGYDKDELALMGSALNFLQPQYKNNLKHALKPGLEFYTKKYAYLSFRKSGFDFSNDLVFFLRGLSSELGQSSIGTLGFEKPIGEMAEGFIEYTQNIGKENSEFLLIDKSRISLGFKAVYF